ncbi:hypothetical protein KDK95_28795 [Actinospica sp. MGRD01-02]|uniref:Uncharacterized protein n=1 Tax=Actinospica acidithermotolerans TaxID=2828514 RepID=A0A941EGR7_9ACTN|nr:hypothetical protein [Actinospica acidithermotolerans]MBR7830335.1 hypothetical protein [Actinospica acidithermotolerans]
MSLWHGVELADRESWDYVPFERVGPLAFGMGLDDAAACIPGFARKVTLIPRHGDLVKRVRFRALEDPTYTTAVTGYFGQRVGLAVVAVDALRGPRVTVDGMQLVGRAPSEATDQLREHALARGESPEYSVEGDAASEKFGLMVRAQRAGDHLLTRLVLAKRGDWASTLHDCIPSTEWSVR